MRHSTVKKVPAQPLPPPASTPADDTPQDSTSARRSELIRARAYELYLQTGCEDGHALEHWLQAEAEVDHVTLASARGRRKLHA